MVLIGRWHFQKSSLSGIRLFSAGREIYMEPGCLYRLYVRFILNLVSKMILGEKRAEIPTIVNSVQRS